MYNETTNHEKIVIRLKENKDRIKAKKIRERRIEVELGV
jgi:hypothetical protein